MSKRLIAFIGALALVAALAGCGGNSMSNAWSALNESHTIEAESWTISASAVNGHAARKVNLSSDNLAALHVKNTNRGGKVFLVLAQGGAEESFDVSGSFDGSIGAGAFLPGKITMRLNFESAKDVDVAVSWR
jgi:archaellum component FlaG (FlaF/FlaG flagellin family)